MRLVISITGRDQAGIIASLSGAIFDAGGNLEDASMTILEGEFAMIALAAFKTLASAILFQKEISTLEKEMGLTITVRAINRRLVRGEKHAYGTVPWILSVLGRDQAGIVHKICQLFALRGLNVTDLKSRILGHGKKAAYALILEVDMPRKGSHKESIVKALKTLEKRLKIPLSFKPIEPLTA